MKASDPFKRVIQAHLEEYAIQDEFFAERLADTSKNIDDCATYIMNQVQKSGHSGFADDEIFGMARHYYDEKKIDIGKPIIGRVVVNHVVEITQEEREAIKQKAIDDAIAEERMKIASKPSKPTKKPSLAAVQQHDLFGGLL